MNDRPTTHAKLSTRPLLLLLMAALLVALAGALSLASPQKAEAANYPTKTQLFFEFDNGGQADKPHVMSYDEYCQRTGWRTIDGVLTYRDEWVRETGIFYNSSNGTLTFNGYLDQTTTKFGQLNRVFVGPGRAANLTVVFNVDWVRNLADVRWSDSLPSCHGAMIANASGGSLTIASDNGSTVDLRVSKTRENKQSFNPIGIYCNGDVAIAGSIDLAIEARNSKPNNVNTDTSDSTYYTSAWGIWAGGKVVIRENAKTSIYANSAYPDNAGVKSAAVYSGHSFRLTDRWNSITSSAEQSFTGANDGEASVPAFALNPAAVPAVEDTIYLGTKTGSSGNTVGSSPKVHCKWSDAGSFVCGYTGNATANTEDRTGYVLVKNDDHHQADYYSTESKYIVRPEVKMTLPRYGQVPGGVSSFTTITPGLTIEEVSYEYIPGNANSYTSLGSGKIIPTDAKGVKVTYTVGARDGYEIAKPYYSGGTYYTMGVFNGQEVKSNTMWYSNTTASFSVELDMDDILPENFVQYVNVMGVTAPMPGAKVPKVIKSGRVIRDEDAELLGSDTNHYGFARLVQNEDQIPENLKYREWWTNDRGEILSNNTYTSTTNDDEFEANRYYTYHVLLEAKDGYVFGGGKYSSVSSLHKFINGYPAITQADQYLYPGPDSRQRYIHICKSFKCPPTAVDEVEVFGVPEPVVGEQARIGLPANPNGTVAEGSPYKIAGDRWKTGRDYASYGTSGDSITSGNFMGTFEANTWYTYEVDLVPIDSTYSFNASSTYSNQIVWTGITATVNGKQCRTPSGAVYANLIRYTAPGSSYANGMLRLRYSFLTPSAEEDTVKDIQLTTSPEPSAQGWPGTAAISKTAGVSPVNLENAPGYSQLGSNGNCQGVGNYTGVWLVGEDTLAQQYNRAIYSNTPFTDVLRARFSYGNTYTFYACVDLGDKYFSFDDDGNLSTTVTVNGYPAVLNVGTAGIAAQTNYKSHVALVTWVYTFPASADEGWLITPVGTKTIKTTHGGTLAPTYTRAGFNWYVFDRTVYHQVKKDVWTPPEGEVFWKWEMLKSGNGVELNYPYRNYVDIKANAATSGDVVLRILTAPEGAVPVDMRQGNWDIYVDSWNNNWGGESSSNRTKYNGNAKLRWPVVKHDVNGTTSDKTDDITLVEGKDYTVSYVNSSGNPVAAPTNRGTYRPVITGRGGYDGSRQLDPYYIDETGIYDAEVTFTGANLDYSTDPATPWVQWTGEAQTPTFKVTYNGMTLVEGTDYEVGGWYYNTNVTNTAYVRITGKGNFSSSKNANFQIRARDINEADVAAIPNETYDGKSHSPEPVVTYEGETLVEGTHYYVTDNYHMSAGPATLTIVGKESAGWTGERVVGYTIDPYDISDGSVNWVNAGNWQYAGDYITPTTLRGNCEAGDLRPDNEFTIDGYSNNLYPGVGTISVTGTGNYTGSAEVPFNIYINVYLDEEHFIVGGIQSSYMYTGEPIKPVPTVFVNSNGHGSLTLTEGTGYTLNYGTNTNAGNIAGWVEIMPVDTDHYKNTKKVYFDITKRDLSAAAIEAIPDQPYNGGGVVEPEVTVKLDGEELIAGTDYVVSYADHVNVGTATATIMGQGNYEGTVSTTFKITPIDLSGPAITWDAVGEREYTGAAIEPYSTYGHLGSLGLAPSGQVTYEYSNNVYPGAATITVKPNNSNFTGSKVLNFDIYAELNDGYVHYEVDGIDPDYEGIKYDYCGTQIKPEPVVKVGDKTLVKDTDYTLEYGENTNIGSAGWVKVVPADTDHFRNDKTIYFDITPCDLSNTIVTVSDQTYTGKALTPKPTVKTKAGVALTEGTDYEITGYANNTDVGTATVSIEAVPGGNFTGNTTADFQIVKPHAVKWDRIYGAIAADTMQKIAAKFGKSSYAIVTTDASFKDALAASSLAGHYKAPVLMTKKSSLTKQTKAAIQACGAKTVIIVGSTSDVTTATQNAIKKVPGVKSVWRVNGSSASQKAVNVAKKTGTKSDTVIIVTQNDYRDALTIAPYAYATQSPILYTETNKKLSTATVNYIKERKFKKAIIIGGPLALPATIDTQLTKAGIKKANITRIAGGTAYVTSKNIALWTTGNFANGNHGTYNGKPLAYIKFQPTVTFTPNNLCVSTGQNWLDALAGAALCGKNKSVMLLADSKTSKSNSSNAEAFCKKYKDKIDNAWVLGGPKAVQEGVYDKLKASTQPVFTL